jgi:hypothetical protein
VVEFCFQYREPIIVIAAIVSVFLNLPGPHAKYRQNVIDVAYFALYWIVLGVASSIGFGTGLHTFVLYLGPYIA